MTKLRSPFELVRVIAVRHVREHVLWLEFSDGVAGEADLADGLIGPVFESLRDPREFARVRLGAETIEWPNGADWAPESLHERVLALSRFFGIVVSMFYADHVRPHFHARCGGESIAVEIDGDGMRGSFPPARLQLLFEWRALHRRELRENWDRLRSGETPLPIAPLE
jgi:hypothetical protein